MKNEKDICPRQHSNPLLLVPLLGVNCLASQNKPRRSNITAGLCFPAGVVLLSNLAEPREGGGGGE